MRYIFNYINEKKDKPIVSSLLQKKPIFDCPCSMPGGRMLRNVVMVLRRLVFQPGRRTAIILLMRRQQGAEAVEHELPEPHSR